MAETTRIRRILESIPPRARSIALGVLLIVGAVLPLVCTTGCAGDNLAGEVRALADAAVLLAADVENALNRVANGETLSPEAIAELRSRVARWVAQAEATAALAESGDTGAFVRALMDWALRLALPALGVESPATNTPAPDANAPSIPAGGARALPSGGSADVRRILAACPRWSEFCLRPRPECPNTHTHHATYRERSDED